MIYNAKVKYEMIHYIRPEQIILSKAHWGQLVAESTGFLVEDDNFLGCGPEIYGMKILIVDEYLPVASMLGHGI